MSLSRDPGVGGGFHLGGGSFSADAGFFCIFRILGVDLCIFMNGSQVMG